MAVGAYGLEVVGVVGAAVFEVLFVVDFGCCGGAAVVFELAGVVVSVEGGLAEFLPLSVGWSVGGLVVPYHLFCAFFVLFNYCLHLCLLSVVRCVVVCTCVGYVRVLSVYGVRTLRARLLVASMR